MSLSHETHKFDDGSHTCPVAAHELSVQFGWHRPAVSQALPEGHGLVVAWHSLQRPVVGSQSRPSEHELLTQDTHPPPTQYGSPGRAEQDKLTSGKPSGPMIGTQGPHPPGPQTGESAGQDVASQGARRPTNATTHKINTTTSTAASIVDIVYEYDISDRTQSTGRVRMCVLIRTS